jgi:hypothetical protein
MADFFPVSVKVKLPHLSLACDPVAIGVAVNV